MCCVTQKPGASGCRAQGWWWEAPHEGLISDGGASDERFTWALAAASALRNLALTPANQPHCASAACVFVLARHPVMDLVSSCRGWVCVCQQHSCKGALPGPECIR